ncbi:MAG: hypothetical protein COA82_01205 [Alkaliphilus sp.]|nr:hypothetical protein [Alkaliphilus sp. AH-315-G20]MBN4074404.1 hypothetical protein [bacterium AH-315-E09]PHS36611.1 MAG: hypothetical protein COA82_01205 [Alkaliphilus sp.]
MLNNLSLDGFELLKSYYEKYDSLFLSKDRLISAVKKAQKNTIEKELVDVGEEVILFLEKIDTSSFKQLRN